MTGRQRIRHLPVKLVLFAALCTLPALGAAHALFSGARWAGWMLAGYTTASLVSLLLYGHDKRQACRQDERIAEKWLHLSELCGGWPGALLAQQLWRHKTRKVSYQVVFWLIVALHQLLWFIPLWLAV